MTSTGFDSCFKFTIGHEGGYGADPRDRGNWTTGKIGAGELKGTKYGIASHAYPDLDIRNLTLDQAKTIYRRDYWAKVAGDQLPAGLDLSVWDMGVNGGVGRGLAILKAVLGVQGAAAPNGLAVLAHASKDKVALVRAYAKRRLAFYQGLLTFKIYGKGWTRRAAECEAAGVKMALQAAGAPAPSVAKELKTDAAKATRSAAKNGTGAVVTTGAPSATQVPDTPMPVDVAGADPIILVLVIIGIAAIAGAFVWRAYVQSARAKALAAASKG